MPPVDLTMMKRTPEMERHCIQWLDVLGVAGHVVHLLETATPEALVLAQTLLKLIELASKHDVQGILAALLAAGPDLRHVIDLIKIEFGI